MPTSTTKPTGKQLVAFLNKYKGYKYRLGVLVPKAVKNYAGAFDCAEFGSYGIYQVGGFLYGCSNNHGNPNSADAYTGFWARDAKLIGKIIPIPQAIRTVGAILLRVAANGTVGHLIISTGDGGTIEANSTKYGVDNFKTTGRRFDYGIILDQFDYTETSVDVDAVNQKPEGVIYRFTSPLMKDDNVGKIQRKLNELGFNCGKVDNFFGSATMAAVKAFQNAKGIVTDGEVGQTTWKLLKP